MRGQQQRPILPDTDAPVNSVCGKTGVHLPAHAPGYRLHLLAARLNIVSSRLPACSDIHARQWHADPDLGFRLDPSIRNQHRRPLSGRPKRHQPVVCEYDAAPSILPSAAVVHHRRHRGVASVMCQVKATLSAPGSLLTIPCRYLMEPILRNCLCSLPPFPVSPRLGDQHSAHESKVSPAALPCLLACHRLCGVQQGLAR